tara:strand:- start:3678 stop:4604 length:927 start_codon:yes stop_codon:yes gene_type:complete
MPLTYNQTQYSTLTVTGTSPNEETTISYSTLDFRPEIGDTIEVFNDTTQLTDGTGGSTVNFTLDTTNKNVILKVNTFTPGTTISVYRIAKKDDRAIDFQNASVLTEADLDNSAFQTFHIAQEALDTAESSITADADGTFDAGSKRIKNVATPDATTDAANKAYVDGSSNTGIVASGIANVNTVAGEISPTNNIATIAGNTTNINTVAGNTTNINTVATNNTNVTNVGGDIANVNTVAGSIANVNTVASDIADVNTVAANIANINAKVDVSGDTMTGALTLSGAPTNALHATTKTYVDSQATALALALG